MNYWIVDEEWRNILQREGMTTLEVALDYHGRKLLSEKKKSRTWLHTTEGGQDIFIKQDTSSRKRAMLRSLIRFQKPVTAVEKECAKLEQMRKLGFNVPKVIMLGAKRNRLLMPDRAVMIMLPVQGKSLDKIWTEEKDEAKRLQARRLAQGTLELLWDKGCDWGKDCKPEHFFISDEGQVSLIDVERMKFRGKPLPQSTRETQLARFNSLLQ